MARLDNSYPPECLADNAGYHSPCVIKPRKNTKLTNHMHVEPNSSISMGIGTVESNNRGIMLGGSESIERVSTVAAAAPSTALKRTSNTPNATTVVSPPSDIRSCDTVGGPQPCDRSSFSSEGQERTHGFRIRPILERYNTDSSSDWIV